MSTSFTPSRRHCSPGLPKTRELNRRGDMELREHFNQPAKPIGLAGLSSGCWRAKERMRESDFCITGPLWALSCPVLHPTGGLALLCFAWVSQVRPSSSVLWTWLIFIDISEGWSCWQLSSQIQETETCRRHFSKLLCIHSVIWVGFLG